MWRMLNAWWLWRWLLWLLYSCFHLYRLWGWLHHYCHLQRMKRKLRFWFHLHSLCRLLKHWIITGSCFFVSGIIEFVCIGCKSDCSFDPICECSSGIFVLLIICLGCGDCGLCVQVCVCIWPMDVVTVWGTSLALSSRCALEIAGFINSICPCSNLWFDIWQGLCWIWFSRSSFRDLISSQMTISNF